MAPFPCGHSINQQRVARMLEVLPFPASKKKLCADCRTKTPEGIFEILNKINDARINGYNIIIADNSNNNSLRRSMSTMKLSSAHSSSSSSTITAPTPTTPRTPTPRTPRTPRTPFPRTPTPRTPGLPPMTPITASMHLNNPTERSAWLAYLLDRLLCHRRTLLKDEGKEGWMTHHLGEWTRVAFLCVRDDDDLRAICDSVRQKHGSGAEEEVLRSLARAALRAYDVEKPNEPATHLIVMGLNELIVAAARCADEARSFAQVREVFASAVTLRQLASAVSTEAAKLYDHFEEFDRASSTLAGRSSSLSGGNGGLNRNGSRRVVSGQSGRRTAL
ncbi:hypothetical protein PGQ11_001978 [Apiospora arundinis]|uniref:Uncharacterized protein n=1 Tax=Apiospora arundinis TaxID=335852 RepID=A0ABR2JGS0_9PEZI